MERIKTISSCFLILTVLGGIIIISPWLLLFLGTAFQPSPPRPEIKHGEFDVCLIYEVNGEIYKIEDQVVCDFAGFENLGTAGKYRKWDTILKSGNEKMILLELSDKNQLDEAGNKILRLFFSYGNGEYYMGDNRHVSIPEIRDYVEYQYITEEGIIGGSSYDAEEAWEKYKIRLISWENEQPIKNEFR